MGTHLDAWFDASEHVRGDDLEKDVESVAAEARIREQERHIGVLQEMIAAQQERIRSLQSEQGRMDAVFGSALQSFLVIDPNGTIQAANPTFASVAREVFGRAPAAGDHVEDFVRARDLDTFRANFQRALQGETVTVTRRFDVDTSPRWFRFVYTPVSLSATPDAHPAVEAVILQSTDVTEQRLVEDALMASEARHRSIVHDALDTSAAGLFILDAEFQIVWINRAVERFFGLDRNEVLGRDKRAVLREQIAPRLDDPGAFTERILATYDDNTRAENFICTVQAAGERPVRHLEHQSLPIREGYYRGGRVEHYYDVTALQRAKSEVEAAREHAERHDEATERFLATLSHEIRSSMTGITGFADLLLDAGLDDDAHYFAEVIRDSGDAVLGLLNDVLDLSRLEAGAVELDPQPFELAPALHRAADAVRAPARKKGLDLNVEVDDALPPVVIGDEMRIRQILVNLLGNAVKFTDTGSVCLSATRGDDPSGDRFPLHLRVADTGIGLSEEEQDTLFDAFQQACPSTSQEHGGSGLGLAIVKELVEAMDGAVSVNSTPGGGSTFHVILPVDVPPA
jgi:PAS domain S-box-containing protein